MTRYTLSLLFTLLSFNLDGQMLQSSANYLNNILAFNPAYAGTQDALSATVSFRNQWVGFRGAPTSSMISGHTPLNNDKIGLGVFLERNSFGLQKETRFSGSYSYKIEFHEGKLAMGLGIGATAHNIDWNGLHASDPDDILLYDNPPSVLIPYFNFGSYYYTRKYFVGVSVPMLFSNQSVRNSSESVSWYSGNNYFFTGGYIFEINRQFKVLPSMLVKFHSDHSAQLDFNTQIILRDRLWLGLGYRSNSIFVGMFQLQMNPQLRLAYSYDYDLGPIGKYSSGSHEIVLNYVFNYYRKVIGPRQF